MVGRLLWESWDDGGEAVEVIRMVERLWGV
jgi:hypothetical protein